MGLGGLGFSRDLIELLVVLRDVGFVGIFASGSVGFVVVHPP